MPLDQSFRHAERVVKAKGPVDGDGDGWVHDGTPKKRPATPREMELGRRMRAGGGAGGGKKTAPAKPKRAAKARPANGYDQKVDRFDRGIDQAIRSGDKKALKDLQQYIRADLDLKKADKDDLLALLQARRDGKDDPAPSPNSNRGKRLKQPAAKKGAEKPEKAPVKAAGAKKGAGAKKAAKKPAQDRDDPEIKPEVRDGAAVRDAAKKAAAKKPAKKAPAKRSAKKPLGANVERPEEQRSPQTADRDRPADRKDWRVKDYLNNAISAASNDDALKAISGVLRAADLAPNDRAQILQRLAERREQIRAGGKGGQPEPNKQKTGLVDRAKEKLRGLGPGSTHGQKTNAWKRLVQRDIKQAKNRQGLDAAAKQIISLHRQGRIRDEERDALLEQVNQKIAEGSQFGLGGGRSRRADAKAIADRMKGQIARARDDSALDRFKKGIDRKEADVLRDHPDLMAEVNAAFKRQRQQVAAPSAPPPAKKTPTRQPPSRPGKKASAARRAKKAAPAPPKKSDTDFGELPGTGTQQVEQWREAISDAKNLDQVDALASALEKIPEGEIDKDDYNRIADMLDAKIERLEVQQQRPALSDTELDGIFGGPGSSDPRRTSRHVMTKSDFNALDPDEAAKTPAGKLLAQGKSIEEAEKANPEGLAEYVHTHPDRFTVESRSGGASGYAFEAIDKQNGKKYFFKTVSNNGPVGMVGDGMNEYMAGALGNAAFGDIFPKVEFAGRPEGDRNYAIRMDHLEQFAEERGGELEDFDGHGITRKPGDIGDPRGPLAIHIFDYLINQTDRHGANFGVRRDKNGKAVVVPVDNGAAFRGYDQYVFMHNHPVPPKFLVEPENVSYREWGGLYVHGNIPKAMHMARITRKTYEQRGWSRDKMRADAEEILEEFRKVEIDQIIGDLEKRFPDMSDYEKKHLKAIKAIWERRLASMDSSDVVRMLMQ